MTSKQTLTITPRQRSELKGRARSLSAALRIGKSGLTAGLDREIERAFAQQELIKLRLEKGIKAQARTLLQQIQDSHACQLVQAVGRVAVFYRPAPQTPQEDPASA